MKNWAEAPLAKCEELAANFPLLCWPLRYSLLASATFTLSKALHARIVHQVVRA